MTSKLSFLLSLFLLTLAISTTSCQSKTTSKIIPGANDTTSYLSLLKDKNIGLLINQSSQIDNTHLLDSLLSLGVNIKKIYTPEHGFRGEADAGAKIKSNIDSNTGIPIISLYGKHRKPTSDDLEGIDIIVFDIQDVGVRFYTYISTLHYLMEACAENNIPLIVLDRPNPNGFYVAGPILEKEFKSFIGMHPVPIVYGLTIGEYATMINGEHWLKNGLTCNLKVIKNQNYDHTMSYDLPIKPSPNLPNQRSILLYPNLCLFEGTVVSIGRGTDKQFQIIGHPDAPPSLGNYHFTPISRPGAKTPKLQNKPCQGEDLSKINISELIKNPSFNIEKLIKWYNELALGKDFFRKKVKATKKNPNPRYFFDKLVGSDQLRLMIEHGTPISKIEETWQPKLDKYKETRKKYLLYKDF